ncbi:hypothetical protein JXA85_05145 [Candidatus Woesearchaeota archaeon]|nr:hypothetical protein [Candidatus Woesearchaeota archaeon]
MFDKKELQKLSIRDRIEALMKIERDREQEIKEAKELIERYEDELEKEEILKNVEIPETEHIDISKLFVSEKGIEAHVDVEQERYKDFNIQYVNIAEGLDDENRYITQEIPVEKLDEAINPDNYISTSKKAASKTTASAGIIDEIRKYTTG